MIRICRIQERDGSLSEMTKTEAGTREIPMGADLAGDAARLARALPAPRRRAAPCLPGSRSAAALAEPAARRRRTAALPEFPERRYWEPVFARLGLPYVTPHSARHSFISTLQAQGIEVGLVAKLAGHASAAVTLAHYTQAVRGGEAAVAALEQAYGVAG